VTSSVASGGTSDISTYEAHVAADIAQLRRCIFWRGGLYCIATAAVLAAANLAFLVLVVTSLKPLRDAKPAGALVDWNDIWPAHAWLFGASAAIGVAGLATGYLGVRMIQRWLGPARPIPRTVWISLLSLPATVVAFGFVAMVSTHVLAGALLMGTTISLAGWLVATLLVATCSWQLTLAHNVVAPRESRATPSELPAEALEYFNGFDAELQEAGLRPMGDFVFDSPPGRCRRQWANASQTVYANASWIPVSTGVMHDFSASSQTEDGKCYETSNLVGQQFTMPERLARQLVILPGASPREVLSRHYRTLAECLQAEGVRPMQIEPVHERWVSRHALATLMAAKRLEPGAAAAAWLSDPFMVSPPGPAPGRPWTPDEVAETLAPVNR
jgi:hypothetical protein